MSERKPIFKRGSELEASSISVSPLKKTKLDDSSSDSHDHVAFVVSSSSSSVASTPGRCSVTSSSEDDDQSSSICSGSLSSETNEIARNSSTVVADLEAHQTIESETSTLITSNFSILTSGIFCGRISGREDRNPVNEALGVTTEMESSLATEKNDLKTPREVSRSHPIPTPAEIEELLSELENDDKQKRFIEKYNFDIVNDEPLEGRYKWDRLKP